MDDAQVQQLVQTWRDQLENSMRELKLRQWCVEQSVKSCGTVAAEHILKFITAPLAEMFKNAKIP